MKLREIKHESYLQSLPPDLRKKAAKLLAAKCTLAARVDSQHESADGTIGQKLGDEVIRTIISSLSLMTVFSDSAPFKIEYIVIPIVRFWDKIRGKLTSSEYSLFESFMSATF